MLFKKKSKDKNNGGILNIWNGYSHNLINIYKF